MTASRYYPRVTRPPSLLPREIEYMDWLDWFIREASTRATKELRRFRIMMVIAVVTAAAATASFAAGLPAVTTAILAFIAVSSAGIQAVLRDQQCGLAKHAMVVELQEAKREFGFGELATDEQLRRRFQDFRRKVEAIKKRRGEKVLKALATPPPKLRSPLSS